MARINLKLLRVKNELTQDQFARRIGCTRAAYSAVESGRRLGRNKFWRAIQDNFDIPDSEMWELMQDDN